MDRPIRGLNYYYNKFKYGEDIFHQLMKFKVMDVLLISTFYDAFILEQDGRLSEGLFGEYKQLELSNYPHITTIPTGEQAVEALKEKKFDLVITLENIGKLSCFDVAKHIKEHYPELPVLLLLNKTANPALLTADERKTFASDYFALFDGVFCWEGNPKIFLAMIKLIEDRKNLAFDTKYGLTRIILVYEKSVKHYTRLLPLIYYELVQQTQKLIAEEYNDVNKRLRMRGRPKVVLVHNRKDALEIYHTYCDYISCITAGANIDTRTSLFTKSEKMYSDTPQTLLVLHNYNNNDKKEFETDDDVLEFLSYVRENDKRTAIILHSSDNRLIKTAADLNIYFLNNDSQLFWRDYRDFLYTSQGFGSFYFRDSAGNIIDSARTMVEFERKLSSVSDESLLYHAKYNHFSTWLIAHGEFQVARTIGPKKGEDFKSISALREYLIEVFGIVKRYKNKGKLVAFNEDALTDDKQIVRMAEGSLGGKGRGIAFLNALMESIELDEIFPEMEIKLPNTSIIGTDEFEQFLDNNDLNIDFNQYNDEEIDNQFLAGEISEELSERVVVFLNTVRSPIAVRSSGLLEDSQSQPFAGIYRTFMLPNNHPDLEVRKKQLIDAIKLVFASIYLKNTRNYIEGIYYKLEEEKMAVVIQEIVGNQFENYFYPHISGVAQSYNYYPRSYITHKDGICSLAVGLGKSVVDRERTLSFCPKYPKIDFMEPFRIVENAQKHLYAVDLSNSDFTLKRKDDETLAKLRISKKEKENQPILVTSVWDYENNTFMEGTFTQGPRVVTFRTITHYNQLPLSELLNFILDIGEKALGIPVEIEFAITLPEANSNNLPCFYLLQIRPINVSKERIEIDLDDISEKKLILHTTSALGNGIIEDIYDLVYIDPTRFDNTKTLQMREEIEAINDEMIKNGRQYILIGPGRWGSSDRFLGIPVKWGQISRAKVIVEVGLKNFIVEASQGSHFFQNVYAMNVGYFTIPYHSDNDTINWDLLKQLPVAKRYDYFVHLKSEQAYNIKIDGRTGSAMIALNFAKSTE